MNRTTELRHAGIRRGACAVVAAVALVVAGCTGSPFDQRGAAREAPADPCSAVTAEQRELLGLAAESTEPRRSTTERLSFSSCLLAEASEPRGPASASPTGATGAMRIRVDRVADGRSRDAADRFEEACEDSARLLGSDSRRSDTGDPGDNADGETGAAGELGDEVCVLTADRPAAVVVVRKGSDVVAVQTYSSADEQTVRIETQRVAAQVLELP